MWGTIFLTITWGHPLSRSSVGLFSFTGYHYTPGERTNMAKNVLCRKSITKTFPPRFGRANGYIAGLRPAPAMSSVSGIGEPYPPLRGYFPTAVGKLCARTPSHPRFPTAVRKWPAGPIGRLFRSRPPGRSPSPTAVHTMLQGFAGQYAP